MSGKTIIYVHNETKTGWKIEETADSRTKLITKPTKIKNGKNSFIEKKLSIGIQSNILVGNVLEKMVDTPRKKVALCNYFGDNINVKFSKKTFEPYIKSEPKSNRQHVILLISLDLKSRKFVSSEQERSCILEYGFNADTNEFNLIVSLDKTYENTSFKIKMYDHKTKKVTLYSYTIVNDKVKMITEELNEQIDTKKRSPIIVKYRPNHPTNVIISHEDDCKELEKFIVSKYKKSNNFTCHSYTEDESLDRVIAELTNSGYRAVTIFQGRGNGKKHRFDKEKVRHFKTTLLLTNNELKRL